MGYIGSFNSPYIGGLAGTRRVIESLAIESREDFRVIEIACATGYTSCMIASEMGCHVTGIDLSEILIQKARERAEKMNLDNTEFQVADAMDLPFEDNSFDAVFGVAITALLPDRERALSEYIRIVKPGGMIATLDMFLKDDAPEAVAHQFNTLMGGFLGSHIQVRSIRNWRDFYHSFDLEAITIQEFYEDVLVNPHDRGAAALATMRMLYHMIINETVRKNMLELLKVRKTALSKDSEQFAHVGYLTFSGRKPY
jgi:ubiquinone/menaquinone biosynthesis C-methylase UbiE